MKIFQRTKSCGVTYLFFINDKGNLKASCDYMGNFENAINIKGFPLQLQKNLNNLYKKSLVKFLFSQCYFTHRGFDIVVNIRGKGGWGDEVHKGYKGKNTLLGKFNNIAKAICLDFGHFRAKDKRKLINPCCGSQGSYKWAQEIGFSEIESARLGYYSASVDYNFKFNPVVKPHRKTQSWHFNINVPETNFTKNDSRFKHGLINLFLAIDTAIAGKWELAQKKAGIGLHPLQDMFAHTKYFTTVTKIKIQGIMKWEERDHFYSDGVLPRFFYMLSSYSKEADDPYYIDEFKDSPKTSIKEPEQGDKHFSQRYSDAKTMSYLYLLFFGFLTKDSIYSSYISIIAKLDLSARMKSDKTDKRQMFETFAREFLSMVIARYTEIENKEKIYRIKKLFKELGFESAISVISSNVFNNAEIIKDLSAEEELIDIARSINMQIQKNDSKYSYSSTTIVGDNAPPKKKVKQIDDRMILYKLFNYKDNVFVRHVGKIILSYLSNYDLMEMIMQGRKNQTLSFSSHMVSNDNRIFCSNLRPIVFKLTKLQTVSMELLSDRFQPKLVSIKYDNKIYCLTKDNTVLLIDNDHNLLAINPKILFTPKWEISALWKRCHTDKCVFTFSVCFSPCGQLVASAGDKGTIRIWDTKKGQITQTIACNPKEIGVKKNIFSICFSFDGKCIIAGGVNRKMKIFKLANQKLLSTREHKDVIESIICSKNGKFIASGSWDGHVMLWDTKTLNLARTFYGFQRSNGLARIFGHPVTRISFSRDGRLIAFGVDTDIMIYNTYKGSLVKKLEGHKQFITEVCFHPNGKYIVSGSFDKTIKIWDLQTSLYSEIVTISKGISSVKISHDGELIIATSNYGTIHIWQFATKKLFKQIKNNDINGLCNISCSPNYQFFVSGGSRNITMWGKTTKILPVSQIYGCVAKNY